MRRLVVGLLLLAVVLVAVDRVGVVLAQRQVAVHLQDDLALAQPPRVTITGFPVLTQAVRGRYDDVRVQLADADLGDLAGLGADIHLSGAHVPLSDLVAGSVDTIPVDVVEGTVTVPYAEAAAQLGEGVTITPSQEGVMVSQTFTLLGKEVPITGSGQIGVDGGDVTIMVRSLDLAGVALPSYLIDQLQSQLSFRYPVPALPLGLRVTAVTATASGFDITARAEDTVLEAVD